MSTLIAHSVQRLVDNYIYSITDKIANRYGIPRHELLDFVKTIDIHPPQSSIATTTAQRTANDVLSPTPNKEDISGALKKPLTAYQNFCNDHRPKLQEQKPTMKFGDISKELGCIWGTFSDTEKKKYTSPPPPIPECTSTLRASLDTNDIPSKTDSAVSVTYTKMELQGKTLMTLKELCTTYNLKKTGKKDEIMTRILQHTADKNKTALSSSSSSTTIHTPVYIDTREVEEDNNLDNPLIFYENDSVKSDDVSTSSTTSFVLDDDDNELAFDYND